jgi:S-adenosylmethionine synthetase
LTDDPQSRVACETFASTSLVLIGGEITTKTFVDFQMIVREAAKKVGYVDPAYGLDYQSMAVFRVQPFKKEPLRHPLPFSLFPCNPYSTFLVIKQI